VLVLVSVSCVFVLTRNNVKTEEQAKTIARNYVNEKYGEEFSDYNISVTNEKDFWTVSYSPKKVKNEIILGGGGPAVIIEKFNGKVISCDLKK